MSSQQPGSPFDEQPREEPVVKDKRRIHWDPATGATPAAPPTGAPGEPGVESVELSQLRTEVAERTADLQRLQAEYANYRKRVERDREAVRDLAVAGALAELLPVLDDVGRARDHGELEGGFKHVAESLENTVGKLGLVKYGEVGDEFDPTVHEALMHSYSDDVDRPTCVQVLQAGYRFGERVVRPARVAVAEPTAGLPTDAQANEGQPND